MARQTAEANTVRVLKSVEYALGTISHTHPTLDFFTNGLLVDGGKDITHVVQDRAKEYDRLNAALIVQPGDVGMTDKRTGGVRRQKYTYSIWGMAQMTPDDKAAGVDLRQKQERIVNDVRQLLDTDVYIKAAAASLGYGADFNGQRVSCIDHHVVTVISDNGNAYPNINFDIICEFDYDESLSIPSPTPTLTAAAGIAAGIDSRIAVRTGKSVYSTLDHTNAIYQRSTSFWGSDINFCCVPVWNSNGVTQRSGALITPIQLLATGHFPPSGYIRFIGLNGEVFVRHIVTATALAVADLTVLKLDAALPVTAIPCARVLPSDWASYIPSSGAGLPLCYGDQESKIVVADCVTLAGDSVTFQAPSNAARLAMYEVPVLYDSSCPMFMIIGGQAVLLSTLKTTSGGHSVTNNRTEINSILTAQGGGYQLEAIDLSDYYASL